MPPKKPYWATSGKPSNFADKSNGERSSGRLLPLLATKSHIDGNSVDPNQGLARMIERGEGPDEEELEHILTTSGPMKAVKAPVYASSTKNVRAVAMTETSGFSKVKDYKLDYEEIEKIPARLNMSELKKWESDELQAKLDQKAKESSLHPNGGVATKEISENLAPLLPATSERDDPRTYTELLDLYSMHEFIIRKGKTLRNTPEFASFKRHYTVSWGNIESLLQMLESFLKSYGVELAYIDGKRLATLASFYSGGLLKNDDLVDCISNYDDVKPLVSSSSQQYHYGTQGHHLAATKIQSIWRMYKQRVAFTHLLIGTRAALLIQRQWASYRAHCVTRKTIAAVKGTRLTRWRQTMETFVANWPKTRGGRRTIIHIPSLSVPIFHTKEIPFYFAQQLGQLTRIADLADPMVNIVMVSPFKPEQEILSYYFTLLEESGIPNVSGRFTLLIPEDVKRLPEGISLTRMILLSFRLLKLLAASAKGKPAFIVPGIIGPEELSLATELNIPLLSPEPRVAQVFGIKSGCRRLLEAADVATAPGATHIHSFNDLLKALSVLILQHREITRWLVKLETEGGSRGHAYFDVSRIRCLKNADEVDAKQLEADIISEIEQDASKRVRLVHSTYRTWADYVAALEQVGAVIEGVPSKIVANITANLFVEPTGEIHLNSVVEPTVAPAFTIVGSVFPYRSHIPYEAVRDAAVSVARSAFRKRIFGYLSIDFVVFESEEDNVTVDGLRLWGVDVDLYLTNNAAAHQFVGELTGSVFDPHTGQAADGHGKQLRYFYSGLLYNPFLSLIRHSTFFSLCHSRHLTFKKEDKSGIVFHLVDVLLRGCLGSISINSDDEKMLKKMSDFQNLLNLELPKQGEHSSESNFAYFSACVRQLSRQTK